MGLMEKEKLVQAASLRTVMGAGPDPSTEQSSELFTSECIGSVQTMGQK